MARARTCALNSMTDADRDVVIASCIRSVRKLFTVRLGARRSDNAERGDGLKGCASRTGGAGFGP
jgi:hypothetical protein